MEAFQVWGPERTEKEKRKSKEGDHFGQVGGRVVGQRGEQVVVNEVLTVRHAESQVPTERLS